MLCEDVELAAGLLYCVVEDLVMPPLLDAEAFEPDGRLETDVVLEAATEAVPDDGLLAVTLPDLVVLPAVLLLVPVRTALAVLLPETV